MSVSVDARGVYTMSVSVDAGEMHEERTLSEWLRDVSALSGEQSFNF
jgi:hypothetical protein